MNKLTKWTGLLAALCMSAAMFTFAGCGGGDTSSVSVDGGSDSVMPGSDSTAPGRDSDTADGSSSSSSVAVYYTVNFESNGGSAVDSQEVEEGGLVEKPADPTRADYIFSGWCTDETLETVWDFETDTVTSDMTLYAGWDAAEPDNTSTADFYWNYEGAPEEIFETKTFANGSRIAEPDTPERDGYYFGGWYTEDGSEEYSKMKKYEGDQDFYAKWMEIFTFEAEDTQLTGLTEDYDLGLATDTGDKIGYNFSGSANGVNLIKSFDQASGGRYVSGLFYRGAYLQFEIDSDRAVEGAVLRLVLSCEYADIRLTSNTYRITVNDTQVRYSDISLGTGAGTSTEPGPRGGFKEIYISEIDLKEGENVIRLTVNNSQTPAGDAGTVDAASPAVDCIRIYSDAELVMTEYEN